jgi:siroheme synthase (precorrin-2 oxidase/ferrochelatase)
VRRLIIDEIGTSTTFRIPAEVKPGRLALMVRTIGDRPKLIEEPVTVVID